MVTAVILFFGALSTLCKGYLLPDATGRNPLYLLRPYNYIDEKRQDSAIPQLISVEETNTDGTKSAADFTDAIKRQVYVARVGKRIVYAARVG